MMHLLRKYDVFGYAKNDAKFAKKSLGEAVYEIRSLSAVWNQHEVLNVINPNQKYTLTRDAMPSLCDGFHTPCV